LLTSALRTPKRTGIRIRLRYRRSPWSHLRPSTLPRLHYSNYGIVVIGVNLVSPQGLLLFEKLWVRCLRQSATKT
jgi:hypothetical protein